MKKEIICDSSSLISITDTGLDTSLEFLAKEFGIKFTVPSSVKWEMITRPLESNLKQYAFSAWKIQYLIDSGILKTHDPIPESQIEQILSYANNLFYVRGKPLTLIHRGEAEMLALAHAQGVKRILVDERTTRVLIEAPFSMKEHMQQEFAVNVMVNKSNLEDFAEFFKDVEIIRSSEFVILAYEYGYFDKFGINKQKALEGALYKLKYSGCSIGFDEISNFVKGLR